MSFMQMIINKKTMTRMMMNLMMLMRMIRNQFTRRKKK